MYFVSEGPITDGSVKNRLREAFFKWALKKTLGGKIIIDENGEGWDGDDFREKVDWRGDRESRGGRARNPELVDIRCGGETSEG